MRKTLAGTSLAVCVFLWLLGGTASAQAISQVVGISVEAPPDGGPVTVSWNEVQGAEGYVVTVLVLNTVDDTEFRRFAVTEQVGAQTQVVISGSAPGPNIAIVQAVVGGVVGPESAYTEFNHPHIPPRILGAVQTGTTTTLQFDRQAVQPPNVTAVGRGSVPAIAVTRPINGTPGNEQTTSAGVGDTRGPNIGPIWMVPLGTLPPGEYEVDLTVADSLPTRLKFTVGGLPVEPIRVLACRANFSVNSTVVTIIGDPRADSYVIYRQVDGRPEAWRGRVDGTASEFVDPGFTHGGFVTYRVAIRNSDGFMNPKSRCVTINLGARSACIVNVAPKTVGVEWTSLDSAAGYLVYRSINGGAYFWRGRDTAGSAPVESFTDRLAGPNAAYDYRIVGIGADGRLLRPIQCEPKRPVDPVSSCAVVINNGRATVTWEPVRYSNVLIDEAGLGPAEPQYVVRRSVDGSPMYWRARTEATSLDDLLRGTEVIYEVQSLTPFDYRVPSNSATRCTTG